MFRKNRELKLRPTLEPKNRNYKHKGVKYPTMNGRNFSISIVQDLENWELIFDILHGEYFTGVELAASYLDNPKLPGLIKKSNMKVTNVTELVQRSILRSVAEQDQKVIDDFFEYIVGIIATTYDFPIGTFMLDLGFDANSVSEDDFSSKVQFLKRFTYALYSNEMTMVLPARVPGAGSLGEQGAYMQKIMRESMSNRYGICLDLFPHEIMEKDSPVDVYRWYNFDLKTIRIIYEPETGNCLTEKVLKHWLKPLSNIDFEGDVVFCPRTNNFSLIENEIKKLSDFIDKLKL